jgi:DNA topoisomerase-1
MKTLRRSGRSASKSRRHFQKAARRGKDHLTINPIMPAREAGLRYVNDNQPGIRRQRRGKRFRYIRPDGTLVRDPEELRRIRALAIPPAWTKVWICSIPQGHLQATGHDAKGRKQYRYHPN